MTLRCLVPAVAALLAVAAPAPACPFCGPMGQTLTGEVPVADFILYGTLKNPQRDPNDPGAINKGTTEMVIDMVIKPHELVKDKKTLTIPRYVLADGKDSKMLIFFKVENGQIDPYRGEVFAADSKLPEYMKGAIEVREKDIATRLKYFFNYLEDPDITISSDAYSEFGYAEYKDVHAIAPKLPAETILKWLKDPNTRGSRLGLYGLIVGHCGKPEHAKALRELLDDKDRAFASGFDGMVAGYILLDPKAGWDYLLKVIKSPDADFPIRYAALKTVRFFWEFRPDVIPNEKVLEAMKLLMDIPDVADMPMEDVRKWKVWGLTPVVLGYATKESHNTIPINNRAVLKFAIAAAGADPTNKAAAEFVAAARKKDPKRVQFLEELLKDEAKPAPAGGSAGAEKPAAATKPGGG